ncbi:MAG: hypothetical protein ACK5JF_03895 [Oscillospiraceae bacterium]
MECLKSIILSLATALGVTTDTGISQADYDAMQARAKTAEKDLNDLQKEIVTALQKATAAEAVADEQAATIMEQNKKIDAVIAAVDGV